MHGGQSTPGAWILFRERGSRGRRHKPPSRWVRRYDRCGDQRDEDEVAEGGGESEAVRRVTGEADQDARGVK